MQKEVPPQVNELVGNGARLTGTLTITRASTGNVEVYKISSTSNQPLDQEERPDDNAHNSGT